MSRSSLVIAAAALLTSMVVVVAVAVAVGATMPAAGGDILIRVNVAVSFAEGGPRTTTLAGWIIG